jgi:hypothetical protein
MTTHELAKKLLEGPDVPVVIDTQVGYGDSAEPDEISETCPVTLWQCAFGVRPDGTVVWGEWRYDKPLNETLTVQSKPVVRLA